MMQQTLHNVIFVSIHDYFLKDKFLEEFMGQRICKSFNAFAICIVKFHSRKNLPQIYDLQL